MKTLKEIAEELDSLFPEYNESKDESILLKLGATVSALVRAKELSDKHKTFKRVCLRMCLEYAKSIVPEGFSAPRLNLDEKQRGIEVCRSQILSSISDSEKELNQ